MAERYKLIPEVFVVLITDGKVLLGRRQNTGWMDGKWGLPGGHGEDRESMSEGAAREALEELGIRIAPADLKLVMVQSRWAPDPAGPHARVGFYFTPTKFEGEVKNMEPEKCAGLEYFPLTALPAETIPHIRAVLEAYFKAETYNDFDWHTR